jgi:hypothetical protein
MVGDLHKIANQIISGQGVARPELFIRLTSAICANRKNDAKGFAFLRAGMYLKNMIRLCPKILRSVTTAAFH